MIFAIRIYALFVVESTRVPKFGGGGKTNFGNAKILTAHILEIQTLSFLISSFQKPLSVGQNWKAGHHFFNF